MLRALTPQEQTGGRLKAKAAFGCRHNVSIFRHVPLKTKRRSNADLRLSDRRILTHAKLDRVVKPRYLFKSQGISTISSVQVAAHPAPSAC
jgi:hypothetical protein